MDKQKSYEFQTDIFKKLGTRCINIKNYCFTNIPNRTKIFLSALWFWMYITYCLNIMFCFVLKLILSNTPDSCIAFQSTIMKKAESTPEIIEAKLGTETITNKIKLLVNLYWDDEISDVGGVNIKDLLTCLPTLSKSVVWISYICDFKNKIQTMTDEEIGKQVKHMLINITDKIIYRNSDEEEEEILFGAIPF